MRILALDSSGLVASVAIVEDEKTIAEYTMNYKKTHSQTLLPMLDEIVKMTETDLNLVDAIAVAKGPGSFTGLRIGAATAKGLALVKDKPIVGVPTLEGLAYNLQGYDGIICPIMDARRNQVYTGFYEFKEDELHIIKNQDALDIMEVICALNDLGRKVTFLGDGVDVYKEVITENAKVEYRFAPAQMNKQRAGSLAVCAMDYYRKGIYENADDFAPDYLRLSQAERERMNKQES